MRKVNRFQFTAEQMALNEMVRSIGLETVLEYKIGRFRLDIFCPECNIGFEFDGPAHSKRQDKKRDQEISDKFGIRIMRVTDIKDPELRKKLELFIAESC